MAWVLMTFVLCAQTFISVCNMSFVEGPVLLFGVWGGVCGEKSCNVFLHALHGATLGSYLRDALQEGSADVVACLYVPRA
jgi:hypothetical protein